MKAQELFKSVPRLVLARAMGVLTNGSTNFSNCSKTQLYEALDDVNQVTRKFNLEQDVGRLQAEIKILLQVHDRRKQASLTRQNDRIVKLRQSLTEQNKDLTKYLLAREFARDLVGGGSCKVIRELIDEKVTSTEDEIERLRRRIQELEPKAVPRRNRHPSSNHGGV